MTYVLLDVAGAHDSALDGPDGADHLTDRDVALRPLRITLPLLCTTVRELTKSNFMTIQLLIANK